MAMFTLNAQADVGPKPTIHIDLQYLDDPKPVLTSVRLLDCNEHPECEDPSDFYEKNIFGPNSIGWNQHEITMRTYDFPQYSKVRLQFKAFELESPVFQTTAFDEKLIFTITGHDIEIEKAPRETTSEITIWQEMGMALGLTLLLELFFGWILLHKQPERKRLMLALLIGNVISLPLFVWLPLQWMNLGSGTNNILLIGESMVVMFEATLLWLAGRPNLSGLKAFGIALLLNVASVLIGGFLLLLTVYPVIGMR
jgi:hypothetical protein